MGVSGCGKSSVGTAVAALCGATFVDGDALHPAENIQKMKQGIALDDCDRLQWLILVGQRLAQHDGPIIIACSALKKIYREWIRNEVAEPVHFLHLEAAPNILKQRVSQRQNHFMPVSLLDSQFEALEPLGSDEWGDEINIARPYAEVVAQSEAYLRETMI